MIYAASSSLFNPLPNIVVVGFIIYIIGLNKHIFALHVLLKNNIVKSKKRMFLLKTSVVMPYLA